MTVRDSFFYVVVTPLVITFTAFGVHYMDTRYDDSKSNLVERQLATQVVCRIYVDTPEKQTVADGVRLEVLPKP